MLQVRDLSQHTSTTSQLHRPAGSTAIAEMSITSLSHSTNDSLLASLSQLLSPLVQPHPLQHHLHQIIPLLLSGIVRQSNNTLAVRNQLLTQMRPLHPQPVHLRINGSVMACNRRIVLRDSRGDENDLVAVAEELVELHVVVSPPTWCSLRKDDLTEVDDAGRLRSHPWVWWFVR